MDSYSKSTDKHHRVKLAADWLAAASLASVVASYNTGTYAHAISLTVDRRIASDHARPGKILVLFGVVSQPPVGFLCPAATFEI